MLKNNLIKNIYLFIKNIRNLAKEKIEGSLCYLLIGENLFSFNFTLVFYKTYNKILRMITYHNN